MLVFLLLCDGTFASFSISRPERNKHDRRQSR